MPRWATYAGAAVLGVACLYIGISTYSCHKTLKVEGAVIRANQAHESAVVNAAQGTVHDAQAESLKAENQRLRERLRKLSQARPQVDPKPDSAPPVGNGGDSGESNGNLVSLHMGDAEKATLLDLVAVQEKQIKVLTLARDDWKRAYEQSAQEAIQLRSALAAKEGMAKAERWKGRLEGLAVGVALGYVGGRL